MNRVCRAPALSFFLAMCAAPAALADPIVHVPKAAAWRYRQGTQEATAPDPGAWRAAGFADASWSQGGAPFGYGDGPYATDLAALAPPMQDNYSTLFLRRSFALADPDTVAELEIDANYDDGFVAWINGVEVLRVNVAGAPGDPVAFDGLAAGDHESGTFEVFDLPDPALYLQAGTNVLAVQVFNTSLGSSDLTLELALYDPLGPDVTAPQIASLAPPGGATVSTLVSAEVIFTEAVAGVEASDLRIGGAPASGVTGSGAGPYVFSFPAPAAGQVTFSWTAGHAIADLASPPNAFAGGPWTVTLDPGAVASDVVIAEILASSSGGLLDEDGEPADWVELLNVGAAPVTLLGMGLTDDPDEPAKWTFPAVTLGAGQRLVVFASGKDRKPTAGNLHTSFQLNAAGEYLGLYSAAAPRTALSQLAPAYPEQRTDISYGLGQSGAPSYFATPTPGAANGAASAFQGFVADPRPSVPRGVHDSAQLVALSSTTPGATIRFTLDGREPSAAVGTVYTSPLDIAGSAQKGAVTLRAIALADGFLPSRVVTHTYIFPAQVLAQPAAPAGFPSTWGAGQTTPADYAMDQRVVADAAQRVAEGIEALPALSIVLDQNDLFSTARGIYSNPSLEGVAWERAASAEMIFPDGRPPFQIDCGLRIQGGSSTSNWKSLKLSMRLLFRDDYGAEKLRYPLYPGSRVEAFDTLVLDAGLNLTWNHPDHGQRVRSQYIRDQFVADLQLATGNAAPRGILAHVYLNGLYWGVYNVHERPDDSYAEERFGGSKAEYDVIRHVGSEVLNGTAQAWNAMMTAARRGMATLANYDALGTWLDVPGFADYMIVNLYCGNDDWPRHNWYASRRRLGGETFRFFSWDAEHVLKDATVNQLGVSDANSPGELFQLLRQSPEFKLLFADRVHRLFFADGPLQVDAQSPAWDPAHPERNRPAALYDRLRQEIDPAIACEAARWGDVRRPTQPYTRNGEWQTELNWLNTQYFPVRSRNVLNQFRAAAAGLYPAVGAPILSQHGGVIAPVFVLSLSLPAGTSGTIHYTVDGSDPRVHGTGAVAPGARTYSSPIALDDRVRIRARTLNGTTWSALADALFTLAATLGDLRLSEIHYNPPGGRAYEFLELWNAGPATLELGNAYFSAGIQYTFPFDTPLAPGEHLVLAADAVGFAELYPTAPLDGVYSGSLDNSGERLTLRDPEGNEVLSFAYDDTGLWPLGADGFGRSLVLADADGDPGLPSSWRASSGLGGSPGDDDPAVGPGGVVISEVLPRGAPPFEDAIELHNPTAAAIAIGGWYLSDDRTDEASLRKFRIPSGTTLPAGGRVVYYEADFNPAPGSASSFELDPRGGGVYLASGGAGGNLSGYITGFELDGVRENVALGSHETSRGSHFSALTAMTFGADQPANVEEFRGGGGAPNAGPLVGPVVIHELRYHPPAGEVEWIELHNLGGSAVALHDAALGRGWRLNGILASGGADDLELPAGTSIPGLGYLLVVAGDPAAFRASHGIPAAVPVVGPFGGALDNAGEKIELLAPDTVDGEVYFVTMDRVRYDNQSPWPDAPDGGEATLERKRAGDYGDDPIDWDASVVPGGTPGAANSVSGPGGENLPPVASFAADRLSGDAPLTVAFDARASFDPDGTIAQHRWTFGDGATAQGAQTTHLFAAPGEYTVALTVFDARGAQASAARTIVVTEAPPPPDPRAVPGDINGDGRLDISDAIGLLGHLFLGAPSELPCGDRTRLDPANRALLSANGDANIDLSDAVYVLSFLFGGGGPPSRGAECTAFPGCPETCEG